MHKGYVLLISLLIHGCSAFAQPTNFSWKKCFGGSASEMLTTMKPTKDKGYILIGTTNTNNNGDVKGYHYYSNSTSQIDQWIVKLNSSGTIQWQYAFGGYYDESALDITETKDSGFVVVGASSSYEGDLLNTCPCYGMVIEKFSKTGSLLFKTKYSLSITASLLQSAKLLEDISGNINVVTTRQGGTFPNYTYFPEIYQFDNLGNFKWVKSVGNYLSSVVDIVEAKNNQFLLLSTNTNNRYAVTMIDVFGKTIWEKYYDAIGSPKHIIKTSKGNYVVLGDVNSPSGDVTNYYGAKNLPNMYTYEINDTGKILRNNTYGNTLGNQSGNISTTADGGYLIAGTANGNGGMVTGAKAGSDYWIVKTDSAGVLKWQKSYGGSDNDIGTVAFEANGGGIVIAGTVKSNDIDVTTNHTTAGGVLDIWILKSTDFLKSFSPSSANAGTIVTIKGIGLTNTTKVTFGGVAAASFVVLNDSTIQATVAANSQSGDVGVVTTTNDGKLTGFTFMPRILNYYYRGCDQLDYNGKTYRASTILFDTLKNVLGTDSVFNIRNIIVKNTTYSSYTDTVCYYLNLSKPTGVYKTYLINHDGCDSIIIENHIGGLNPPIDVVLSNKIICNGQQVTLTASGADTYTWMPGNLSGASITVNPSQTITYVVTGKTKEGCVGYNKIWKTVSDGNAFSAAIKNDGTLWMWGSNNQYQLGDTTITQVNSPFQIGKDNDWDTVVCGEDHVLALKVDGSLWAWGDNLSGECGVDPQPTIFGSKVKNIKLPTRIGVSTNWKQISVGAFYNLALQNDGTLWSWGNNTHGQLGNGTSSNYSYTPSKIGVDTDWIKVSASSIIVAGEPHSLALKKDSSIYCWGESGEGQLGVPTTNNKLTPLNLISGNDWIDLYTSVSTSYFLKKDGTIWGCGDRSYYKLGDSSVGNVNIKSSYTTATQLFSNCTNAKVVGSQYSTLVLKNDGSYWGCGNDYLGSLGTNSSSYDTVYTLRQISPNIWSQVSMGVDGHCTAIKNDGSLWGWGDTYYGQVGNGWDVKYTTGVRLPANIYNVLLSTWSSNTGHTVVVRNNVSLIDTINSFTACNSFTYKGINYSQSTVIIDTVKYFGQVCDSVYHCTLITIKIPLTIKNSYLHGSPSVIYNGVTYTNSTVLQDTIKSGITGCDSVYNLIHISICNNNVMTINTVLSGCNTVIYKGQTFSSSTNFIDTVKSVGGCDSLYNNVAININPIVPITLPLNVSGCGQLLYKGILYSSNSLVFDTIKSYQGCDSVILFVSITIYPVTPITITTNLSGCGSVTYKSIAYTASTTVLDTIRNSNGCDSIYNVTNISVMPLASRDTIVASCGVFNWYGTNYTNDTVASHHIINYVNTALNEGFNAGTTAPNGWIFTKISGTYTTAGNYGAASPSLKFAATGDQIITPTLSSPATQLSFWLKNQGGTGNSLKIEGYDGTNWIIVNTITSASTTGSTVNYNATSTPKLPNGLNQFRFTYTKVAGNLALDDVSILYSASSGCDSLLVLHLSIKKTSTSITPVTINQGDSTLFNGIYYKSSGTYTAHLLNSAGCDSTATLMLTVNTAFSISGNIRHPKSTVIPTVSVGLSDGTKTTCDAFGNYAFNGLTGSNYTITPSKNNDVNKTNGITVLDAILVQSHILGKVLLNSPYKIIAADVDNSGSVTVLDIIYMKRLILGIDTTFKGNRLWAFVDSSYKFTDSTKPFPHKDSISFIGLGSNQTGKSFIGVKLGDVNYDWDKSVLGSTKSTTKPIELYYDNINANNTTEIRVPIKVNNFKDILGMQYTMNYNSEVLEFRTIENNKLGVEYGINQSKNGKLAFLYADAKNEAKSLNDGDIMMELIFIKKATITSEDITLSSEIASIEAWNAAYKKVNLVKTNGRISGTLINAFYKEIWNVSPNPTNGLVNVNLLLTKEKDIQFELTTQDGKLMMVKKVAIAKGNSSYELNLKQKAKLVAGVYFLKAIGIEGMNTKRIIIK